MIAEYERAKLLERVRRGRRHAARFEIAEDEARLVRRIFACVGLASARPIIPAVARSKS